VATLVVGAAALIGLLMPMQAAQADPTTLTVNMCSSRKIKAAGKYGAARSGCYIKAATLGYPVADARCLEIARVRLLYSFSNNLKLKPPCLTTGDGPAIDAEVLAFVDTISTAVGNTGTASKCDAAKLKCVGKYVAGIAGCYAKAAAKAPGAVDLGCISKREDQFSGGGKGCYDKAVAASACSNITSTADAVRTTADTFLITTVCQLNPGANPDCS
jgi:hypothetical protein